MISAETVPSLSMDSMHSRRESLTFQLTMITETSIERAFAARSRPAERSIFALTESA